MGSDFLSQICALVCPLHMYSGRRWSHVEIEREVWGSPLPLIFTFFLVQPRYLLSQLTNINQLVSLVPLGKQGSSAVSQNTPLLLGMIP